MTDPDVYRRAADVIRCGGLTKGAYEYDGAHCTIGAVLKARGVKPNEPVHEHIVGTRAEIGALAGLLGNPTATTADLPPGWSTVTQWNDADGRTAADVITLLEQAAEKAEASETITP